MCDDDALPVWQKIYQIISGSNKNIITGIADEIVNICVENLSTILLKFKPYTKISLENWKKIPELSAITKDDELCSFVHSTSKELDLDVCVAWSVICNFFIFDYYGKVDEIKLIIRYESNTKTLFDHLWIFYTSDRMFLLKTLRFIFEKLHDDQFIYYEQLQIITKKLNFRILWNNCVKLVNILITEINLEKSKRISEDTLSKWIKRNHREQIEILLIMIHLSNSEKLELTGDELNVVLKLFMQHGFGRHPLFYGAPSLARPKDIDEIKNAEIGVVLALVKRFWNKHDIFKILPAELETGLEQYQVQGDNTSILFIWSIFKSTLDNNEHLEYSRKVLELLLNMKVFKSLSYCVTLPMFQNNRTGDIIMESIKLIFKEFVQLVDDNRFVYEQEGVIQLICELYKRPELVAIEEFGAFFEIGLDMFPYMLDNFLSLVEAVIISGKNADQLQVLKVLHNCPTYCTNREWTYVAECLEVPENREWFTGTTKILIPKGTLAEKCSCFGMNVTKFHMKFDFFHVMERSIRSLTMWYIQMTETNKLEPHDVLRSTKFLNCLIKHFKPGHFHEEELIKLLLQKLDCLPSYIVKPEFRNYELFYEYFQAKCSLLKYRNVNFYQIFPFSIRKMIFPPEFDHDLSQNKSAYKYEISENDCVLYNFLKEEEHLDDHKLLKEYIDLIWNLLTKGLLYDEILYGGVWYLLFVVFPSVKHWRFEKAEEFQHDIILHGCFRIFVKILQNVPDSTKDNVSSPIFNLVQESFLQDPYIIDNFYNIYAKDKFYIPNVMHQESNWISGNALIVLETVKLELLILSLNFKPRLKFGNSTKCEMDNRIHTFAQATSGYFITPYNSTLAIIAGNFLDQLGKDDSIPLMSCLGLDYDQIQTLFLERLRDPMVDEGVKLNILDIISTSVFTQTGMTAAFFNIECCRKWYSSGAKKIIGDTVCDFMMDYLKNINKSINYLKCPLQVGILKVMSNIWESKKHHLIKNVISSKDFWPLLIGPLLAPFEESPLVYCYIFKIIGLELAITSGSEETSEKKEFHETLKKFLCNHEQLKLFQQYSLKTLMNNQLEKDAIDSRELLIKNWCELIIAANKEKELSAFPSNASKYLFIEAALDGIKNEMVLKHFLNRWFEYILIVIDNFGLKSFEEEQVTISRKLIILFQTIASVYGNQTLIEKKTSLTILIKIIKNMKNYYKKNPESLADLLGELGELLDHEYSLLEEMVYYRFRNGDDSAKEWLGPWCILICLGNCLLEYKECDKLAIWFSNIKYLEKMINSICELIVFKDGMQAGKLAMHSLVLYLKSSLGHDFLKINMLVVYNRLEPIIKQRFLNGQFSKLNVKDLKDGWVILNLLIRLNQVFLEKFNRKGLDSCFIFLTLNETLLKHILSLPENTVDLSALDLLTQLLIFYNQILKEFKDYWYLKHNECYNFMMIGVRRVINSCISICLRPKHIGFYYMDNQLGLVPLNENANQVNDLMISISNRIIGILSVAFSCLYKINPGIVKMLSYYNPQDPLYIFIENDFSVPRFELPVSTQLTYGTLLCLAHILCKVLNQLHRQEDKDVAKINEFELKDYIGLVDDHEHPNESLPDQKLSAFLGYLHEYSGLIDPWINKIYYENTKRLADILMLFIGQQTFLTIKLSEPNVVLHYKRNLYSEFQFFHEYIKKRTSELLNTTNLDLSSFSGDMDHIRRYLLKNWQINAKGTNDVGKVADENFLLIVSFWFSNMCLIQ